MLDKLIPKCEHAAAAAAVASVVSDFVRPHRRQHMGTKITKTLLMNKLRELIIKVYN